MNLETDGFTEFLIDKVHALPVLEDIDAENSYIKAVRLLVKNRSNVSEQAMEIIEILMRVPFMMTGGK